jgi:hypothetical protein
MSPINDYFSLFSSTDCSRAFTAERAVAFVLLLLATLWFPYGRERNFGARNYTPTTNQTQAYKTARLLTLLTVPPSIAVNPYLMPEFLGKEGQSET